VLSPNSTGRRKWTQEEDDALRYAMVLHAYVRGSGGSGGGGGGGSDAGDASGGAGDGSAARDAGERREGAGVGALAVSSWTTGGCRPGDDVVLPWTKIAADVATRTDVQCRERWTSVLDPEVAKAANRVWSQEDDDALLAAIDEFTLPVDDGDGDGDGSETTVVWAKVVHRLGVGHRSRICQKRHRKIMLADKIAAVAVAELAVAGSAPGETTNASRVGTEPLVATAAPPGSRKKGTKAKALAASVGEEQVLNKGRDALARAMKASVQGAASQGRQKSVKSVALKGANVAKGKGADRAKQGMKPANKSATKRAASTSAAEAEAETQEVDVASLDVAALTKLTMAKLKEILSARGLPTVGKKADLILRLDENRSAAVEDPAAAAAADAAADASATEEEKARETKRAAQAARKPAQDEKEKRMGNSRGNEGGDDGDDSDGGIRDGGDDDDGSDRDRNSSGLDGAASKGPQTLMDLAALDGDPAANGKGAKQRRAKLGTKKSATKDAAGTSAAGACAVEMVGEEGVEDTSLDIAAHTQLTMAKLKEMLSARGLPTVGKKADLILRLEESRPPAAAAEEAEAPEAKRAAKAARKAARDERRKRKRMRSGGVSGGGGGGNGGNGDGSIDDIGGNSGGPKGAAPKGRETSVGLVALEGEQVGAQEIKRAAKAARKTMRVEKQQRKGSGGDGGGGGGGDGDDGGDSGDGGKAASGFDNTTHTIEEKGTSTDTSKSKQSKKSKDWKKRKSKDLKKGKSKDAKEDKDSNEKVSRKVGQTPASEMGRSALVIASDDGAPSCQPDITVKAALAVDPSAAAADSRAAVDRSADAGGTKRKEIESFRSSAKAKHRKQS